MCEDSKSSDPCGIVRVFIVPERSHCMMEFSVEAVQLRVVGPAALHVSQLIYIDRNNDGGDIHAAHEVQELTEAVQVVPSGSS